MLKTRKSRKSSIDPKVRSVVLGVLITVLMLLAIPCTGSILILKEWLPESAAPVLAAAAVFLSAFLGPQPIIRARGSKPLPTAFALAGILVIALFLLRMILWPGSEFRGIAVLLSAAAGAVGAAAVCAKKHTRRHRV